MDHPVPKCKDSLYSILVYKQSLYLGISINHPVPKYKDSLYYSE